MKSAYWVVNRILAKWNKIEYNRKKWEKEKISEWVRGLCAYVGDLVCICVQWVNMSPFPYSGSPSKWVRIAEGQLKKLQQGRQSIRDALSLHEICCWRLRTSGKPADLIGAVYEASTFLGFFRPISSVAGHTEHHLASRRPSRLALWGRSLLLGQHSWDKACLSK